MGQLPPIAIVGVSCRMPGGDGIADYWKLIETGSSAIAELPDDRLNRSLYFDTEQGKVGRSYTELGGIVPDRPVNRSICPISDELLRKSDVAHLNLCEVASAALQHAGIDPKNVPYTRTGVFVGHSGGSCLGGDAAFARYAGVTGELLKNHMEFKGCSPAARADLARRMVERLRSQFPDEKTLKPINFAAANAAMLISRVHGFEGPSLVIDAACASSLMALSQAAQSLARGEIDMAVAGGASYSKWFGLVLFSMAMSISPTGSRPFDSDADGLISSDGYGIVILKTLSRAIADGDRILSVIRGIGVSSDGRGKSLWAPRPEGQMLAVERAYSKDVTPASLQYIECHATSTQVGDATELKTLSHVFANKIPAGRKIPIGSVKANIGHALEAAGIAGLIKTVLAMDKGVIPPQINFKTPNPQIDWDNIPFEVATQARQWDRPSSGMPRRAAVNSFGIGGLNVHMVLDDGLLPGESGKTQVSVPSKVSGVASRSSESARTQQQPIAIIGTSAILPGALTKAAMWELLVSGKDPKCDFPKSHCSEANALLAEQQATENPEQTTRGGYISNFVYDWKRHKVPPKQIANANPLQFMLLDAADQALEDAGYGKRTFDRTKAAVVVGTMFGGDFSVQLQLGFRVPHIQQELRELLLEDGVPPDAIEEAVALFEKQLFKVMPALLDETGSFTSSTLASRLSKSFDFCGGAFSLESDEVSGLVALNAAIGMLDTGASDMVLCAAGHQSMSYNSFEKLLECNLLSRGDSRSGFDAAFDGVLPAEGVAVVVLKRLADAERDGDPIRAIIRGTAQCTNKGEESATFHRAFREACEVAGTSPENIGLLESAGIESPSRIPDNAEIVHNIQNASGEQAVCISSLTPQFGYLRGAAGVASIVKAVLEIEHATIPPVYGLQNLSEMAQPTASAIPREKQPLFATMPDGHAQIAINNTSEEGFGFSIILESRAELPKRPVTKTPEIAARLSAAPTRPKVASAAVSATRPAHNRLALAFPGQGSYYAGMGAKLLEDYPVARERLAEFNRALRLEGCPEFETLAADPGSSILSAQLSMLVIDLLYYAVYQTSGVKPDFVCGHSYGEFPALVAAGALTFQNAVKATKLRSAVVEEFGGKQGGLLAISSDAATIRQLLTRSTIEVFLANINSPEQTVVGGTPEDLRQFEQMLKAKRIGSRMLKVPAAYHTPLLEPALATYRDCIRDLPITPPHIPVISGIGNCLVLDPEVIRENLVMQLVSPMDFVGMIEVLQQQKVGTVVEVGPRKVLAQLIQKTVSETDLRCLPMDPRDASSPEWSSTLLATRKVVETPSPKPPAPTISPRTKTPVAQAVTAIPPTAKDAGSVVTEKSRIIHFDATARRKEQNRERALKQRAEAGKPEIGVAAPQAVSAPVPERNGHAANGRAEANGWHAPPASTPAAEPVVAPVAEPVVAVVEAPAAPRVLPNRAELQAFVIEYIVDQTGYPAEMVEMEADLEADLGIDSIKKAQMMGECAQKFELHWLANEVADLSLDQFPTLESIVKFLTEDAAKTSSEPAAPQTVPVVAAPAAPSMPAPVSVPVVKAQPVVAPAAPPVVAAAVEAVVEAPAAPRVLPNRAELQAFVIEYIVDQTGYPAEMVEMEADLEADLGIDSIKKAQMMGECAQKFELHWLANEVADLSLDQFPTLESIVKFLTEDVGQTASEPATQAAPVAATPVSAPVVKAQPTVAPDAPPVAAALEAKVEAPAAARVLPNRVELQAFVIEYIVDQTGYPAEMVEMEADLEADLGIDSIKKAQMMGEFAQKFELHWLANEVADLSLDQFPTLESIVKFLTEDAAKATKESTAEVAHEEAPSVKPAFEPVSASMNGSHASPAVDLAPATAASSTAVLDWEPAIGKGLVTQVVLSGDAYQIGLQHGRQEREAIHAILERQISRYGSRLDNMPELDQALMDPGRYFGEEEVAELQGIADGAELPVGFLVGHNLGLCEDYVPGCVHFAITSGVNGRHGLIHAANEDSSLALSLTDSLKRIVQYRAPAKGYRHVAFSVTGQLCGINGTNEKGLTVSSTLLLDRAPRDVTAPGDIHPVLIKRILENAATPEEAVEILKGSKRNGAWGICISHSATDSLSYVEYDSDQIEVRTGMTRVVGTNHSLLLGATHPTPPHSIHRMERLNELLNSHEAEGVTSQIAEASLRDQFDGRRQRVTAHPTMNTICRVDNQISVVMSPARKVIRVTPGPAKKEIAHEFSTLTVEEFFRSGSKKNDPAASSSVGERSGVDSARVAPKTNRFDGFPAVSDRVMRRVVLRPRQESLPNPRTAALPLTGRSLVYGTGEVAETLVARLRESGLTAELLNVCDNVATIEADFEKLIASQPMDHLFVVGPKTLEDVAAGNASDRFVSTFRVCQLWTQWAAKCGNLATSTMTAITFMGGNFGLNGSPSGADGGALTGLWKALRRELGVVPARVIDFSGDESAIRVVEQLQSELAHPFQTCEVAYSRGERFVLSARPVPSSPQNDFGPTPGTAWIVTGGARGVTAVVARELGLRCGVHLHLIGSSPLAQVDPVLIDATVEELKPLRRQLMSKARERGEVPLDAWNAFERGLEINRTLREMAHAGVSVTYHACDVSDAAAVQETISAIRSLNVPIEGVIHGAGVENACRFDRKQMPKVRKTFDVKVDGAKNLAMALEHDPVVFFVGFGSTSGRFGGLGQADYSAASDSLAKFCNELGRKRPDCRTITVHWPPWGEVGMAARPESKLALEAGGMAFMPPREGVAFLLEELCSAAPEPEILIVDKPDGLDLDKTLPARAEWDDYAEAQGRVESSPLLETVVEFEQGRLVKVEARFNPATDPFLYDHQHKNAPILPMAFGMETLAETLKVLVPELTSLTISNTEIVNGMRFFADRPEVVTARVEKVGDHYVGELVAKFLNRKGVLLQNERVLVKAELRPVTAAGSRVMPVPSTAASETVEYADTWEQIGEPRFGSVFTGPTIRGVTEISRESDSFTATIVPPSTAGFAGSRPTTGWLTSPAVLDACFIGCDRWTSLTLGRLHLPQTFDEVQFHQVVPDGQPCRLFGQVLEVGENQIRYDFSLWNSSGQALIEARGFQVVSASTSQVVSTPPQTSPAPVEKVETPVATQTESQESAAPQLLFPLEAITSSADLWEAEVRIEPLTEPLLNGHRFNNSPLLPGVAMVELFTEALREVCPGNEAPRVRNFQIHHSLHLKAALPRRVQVVAQRSSDGFDCRLVDLDGGNILLATAKIDRVPVSPESLPKLDKPKGQFGPMKYPDVGPLIHGAPLRSLHALCSGRDDAWAEILPTEISTLLGKGSTCQPVLHPAVLDASFFACGVHAWINFYGRVELPLGFDELLILRNEPLRKEEKLMARIRYRDSDDTGSTYDLTLFDTDKQPVYFIKGYRSVAKGSVSL